MPVPPNLPVLAGEKALGKLTDDLAPAARHFAEKVSGSPAEQLGELFADKIRFRRWKNQIRLLNKATEYATEAGIDPESVSLTILTPLIEKAANEEDESMADRWAALLANASSERTAVVSPSFPDVLSRMSPLDALVFDAVALALGNYAGLEATVIGVNSGSIAAHHGMANRRRAVFIRSATCTRSLRLRVGEHGGRRQSAAARAAGVRSRVRDRH